MDESLQRAKIDYLVSDDIEERYKSPAYWAHLVLIGNIESITKPREHWLLEVMLIIVLHLPCLWHSKKNQT